MHCSLVVENLKVMKWEVPEDPLLIPGRLSFWTCFCNRCLVSKVHLISVSYGMLSHVDLSVASCRSTFRHTNTHKQNYKVNRLLKICYFIPLRAWVFDSRYDSKWQQTNSAKHPHCYFFIHLLWPERTHH